MTIAKLCRLSLERVWVGVMSMLIATVVAYGQTSVSGSTAPLVNNTTTLARCDIKPSHLPAPNASEDAVNPPRVVPRPPDAKLNMPPGFSIGTFAEGAN